MDGSFRNTVGNNTISCLIYNKLMVIQIVCIIYALSCHAVNYLALDDILLACS